MRNRLKNNLVRGSLSRIGVDVAQKVHLSRRG